jgi:tetratricopeptide (TPR) repeat protein
VGRSEILGGRRAARLRWFGDEVANVRAALDRLEQIAPRDAARAADHLAWFWVPRGQIREGRERFEALLASNDLPAETRAMLLYHLSEYESRMGDTGAAESRAREARRLAEEAGESRTSASGLRTRVMTLLQLSSLARLRGDPDEAMSRAMQGLEEAGDDEWLRSNALDTVAYLELETGRDLDARTKLLEAVEGFRAAGDVANELELHIQLATLELYAHDFEAARRLAASVLDKVIGDDYRTTRGLNALGLALVGLDRRGEAREAFAQSLDLVVRSGMTGEGHLAETLAGIAYATENKARFDSAVQLLGAVHRLDGEAGYTGPRRRELEQFFAQPLVDALGAEEYASEQAKGATRSLDDAVELARSLLSS